MNALALCHGSEKDDKRAVPLSCAFVMWSEKRLKKLPAIKADAKTMKEPARKPVLIFLFYNSLCCFASRLQLVLLFCKSIAIRYVVLQRITAFVTRFAEIDYSAGA